MEINFRKFFSRPQTETALSEERRTPSRLTDEEAKKLMGKVDVKILYRLETISLESGAVRFVALTCFNHWQDW